MPVNCCLTATDDFFGPDSSVRSEVYFLTSYSLHTNVVQVWVPHRSVKKITGYQGSRDGKNWKSWEFEICVSRSGKYRETKNLCGNLGNSPESDHRKSACYSQPDWLCVKADICIRVLYWIMGAVQSLPSRLAYEDTVMMLLLLKITRKKYIDGWWIFYKYFQSFSLEGHRRYVTLPCYFFFPKQSIILKETERVFWICLFTLNYRLPTHSFSLSLPKL